MYDVGDIVPLGLSVTDAAGVPANGGAVTLTIGLPDGTAATPAPVNSQTGQYTVDYPAAQEGLHTVSWVVTGTNATAYRDVFNVREITNQVISVAEAKRQLRLASSNVSDDELRTFIAAAAVAVEDHTGRKLVRRTIANETHLRVNGALILNRSPVQSLTSLTTLDDTTTWDVSTLHVDEPTGIVTSLSGTRPYGNLKATYVCGKRIIPANELLACRIIVEHLWQTMRPFSSSVASLAPGALEDSLDARSGGLVGFAIPNRALELLGAPPPLVA